MRRRGVVAVTAATVLAATAACASEGSTSSDTSGTINVLVVNDTSGPYKVYGAEELLGVQASVKYLNSKGGIAGRRLKVTHLNDNGEASTAVSQTVKELSAHPGKYSMVWAGTEGTEVAALIPVVQKYDVFAMSIVDTGICADARKCPHHVSLDSPTSAAQQSAVNWFAKRGYKKVGILSEQIAFARAEVVSLKAALRKQGIAYSEQSFAPNTVDVTPQVAALKDTGAQAVFAAGIGPAAGYTLTARGKAGWDVPVLFDASNSSLDITKLVAARQLEDTYISALYCQDGNQTVPGFGLLKKFAPSGLNGQVPCQIAGSGWSSMLVFAHAVRQAKSSDHVKVTKAIESLSAAAQTDPLYVNHQKYGYSAKDHENIASGPSDYHIIPVGPLVGSRVQPGGK